jgi:hypothetical protein
MSAQRKITLFVEEQLLADAQAASGLGVSEVVRAGLRTVVASAATRELRTFRGKAQLALDVDALRRDR